MKLAVQSAFFDERKATSTTASPLLILRKAKVGLRQLVAFRLGARDGSAAVEFPKDEREHDDLGRPDLQGGEHELQPIFVVAR